MIPLITCYDSWLEVTISLDECLTHLRTWEGRCPYENIDVQVLHHCFYLVILVWD